MRRGIFAVVSLGVWGLLFFACATGRVEHVTPNLYQTLPTDLRTEVQSKRQKEFRIVQGKLAKARADLAALNQEVLAAEKVLQDKDTQIEFQRKSLRELKRDGGNEHEVRRLKEDLQIARHEKKVARQVARYRNETKKTHLQRITVLESRERVLTAQMELDKIKSVHEYTEWKVPEADYQVATFRRQVRRFELRESHAKYALAKQELKQAEAKRTLRFLEGQLSVLNDPSPKEEAKPKKSFWGDLIS